MDKQNQYTSIKRAKLINLVKYFGLPVPANAPRTLATNLRSGVGKNVPTTNKQRVSLPFALKKRTTS